MKAKKNSAQQIMMYIILFCIIIVAAVYFLVYKKYEDKAAKIKSSNDSLQVRVTELKGYYESMEDNQASIDSMKTSMKEMLDEFDADDIKEEDVIVQAIKTLAVSDTNYTNINIAERNAYLTIEGSTIEPANVDGLDNMLIFVERDATYVAEVDYINLKQCIAEINKRATRGTISNIAFTKSDKEEYLEGTIEYNFYYVIGTDKEYVPVELADYVPGLEDMFKLIKPEETEEGAEENTAKTE